MYVLFVFRWGSIVTKWRRDGHTEKALTRKKVTDRENQIHELFSSVLCSAVISLFLAMVALCLFDDLCRIVHVCAYSKEECHDYCVFRDRV